MSEQRTEPAARTRAGRLWRRVRMAMGMIEPMEREEWGRPGRRTWGDVDDAWSILLEAERDARLVPQPFPERSVPLDVEALTEIVHAARHQYEGDRRHIFCGEIAEAIHARLVPQPSERSEPADTCGYLLGHVNVIGHGSGPSPCGLPKGHSGDHAYPWNVSARPADTALREALTYTEEQYLDYGARQYRRGRAQAEYEAQHGEIAAQPTSSEQDR